jgi:hypothetical protein
MYALLKNKNKIVWDFYHVAHIQDCIQKYNVLFYFLLGPYIFAQ